jgi:hypothetical protein
MILPGLAVLLLAVPLAYSLWAVMDKNKLELGIRTLLETKTYTFADADIIKVRIKPYTNPLRVTITIRARRDTISDKQAKLVALYLARYMEKPIDLTINITPIEQIVISSDDSLSEN